MRKFEGHDQGQYVLRSCFGGATENFVLSGSAGEFCLVPRAVFSRAGAVGEATTLINLRLSSLRCADGKIVVYHRDTGRLLHRLTGHDVTTVNAVAWNPDPRRAMWASCSDDRTVRIWEMGPALASSSSVEPGVAQPRTTNRLLRPLSQPPS